MARHIDFDAAWEALSGPQAAPTLTIHGELVTLPADEPVALVLLRRQLEVDGASVTYDRVLEVLGVVVGADVVARWVDAGIGREKLAVLVVTLASMWMPEADPGEARPPATGVPVPSGSSTTSSTAGGSSSATSPASTGST